MSATNETAVRQLKFWIVVALTVAGGGFGTAMYLNQYARASDLDDMDTKVTQHESRISAIEAQSRNIEEDYHQVASQLFEIAKTIGARQIPEPPHRESK